MGYFISLINSVYARSTITYFLVLTALSLMFQGCYGEIIIRNEPARGARLNEDSTRLLFYNFMHAYRPSRGFPETPISFYRNTSLYILDLGADKLSKVKDFGPLSYTPIRWNTEACFAGDSLVFKIEPLHGWDKEISMGMDPGIAEKHSKWYIAGPDGRVARQSDTLVTDCSEEPPFPQGELNRIVARTPFEEWQVDIGHIFPRRRSQAVNQLIEFYGNQLYRDALILHLSPNLDSRDIDRIIRRIDRRYNRLGESEQRRYERARERTVSMLRMVDDGLN